ncbi:Holo-[acyl-carrier-protein] synthase [Frankliniella fusca]|uniref:Holo-[acyl-carrier-protein] synthase n=1 Tax=Frankliniella fusca TaxID=407009 RepID=A0AAE1H0A1_9NEOP|nr:Holo-[acyl-carrier-protein] synthase [Frankliniella fusca]
MWHIPSTETAGSPEPEASSGFLVDTPGCRIPFLAPLDEAVRPFVFPAKRVNCEDAGPALVEADPRRDVLHLRRDRALHYNVSEPARLACCARAFWRPAPSPAPTGTGTGPPSSDRAELRAVDDVIVFAANCTEFPADGDELAVSDEFVRVECYERGLESEGLVYRDVFGFTPPGTRARTAESAAATEQDNDVQVEDVVDPDTPRVSILVVGADSVSRSNLLRQMPRTVRALREIGAIDMLGYNKVEDNTFPNLVAVLAGLSVPELRSRCWPSAYTPFDDCPFLWKRFEALGYRTAYAEDEPWMGIFNYIKTGFLRQPVHYYMRPYARLLLKELGSHQEFNCHLCAGPRFQLQALLDYAARFARLALAPLADPLFGLFWGVSLTHDQLNTPQLADPLYASWLRTARADGVLDKSVVVFLSDHGIRWGDIRETYQGRLEERLPFLMISLPRWLRERYPSAVANLRRNSRRLVTPYDLHATLEDLMDLSRLEQRAIKERAEMLSRLDRDKQGLPRAVSMFLVAPETRSCEDAAIEPHWCTCYSSTPVPSNHTLARRAAAFVVRRINAMLSGYRQCARLALDAVLDARRQQGRPELGGGKSSSSSSSSTQARVTDYSLLLRTAPGGALFEATVRVRSGSRTGRARPRQREQLSLSLAGTVSRVNRYGSQSSCVADYHMKLYCYCKGFTD